MADNLGPVNPVSRHFLDRDAREEPYQGRHSRKNHANHPVGISAGQADPHEDELEETAAKDHIDLRI